MALVIPLLPLSVAGITIDVQTTNKALDFGSITPGDVCQDIFTGEIFKKDSNGIEIPLFSPREPSIQTVASSLNVTPDADSDDQVVITSQSSGLTIENPTGTPVQGQVLVIRVKDNGVARSITFGTQYRNLGATLPVTTVISKLTYIVVIYNADDTKWDCISVPQEL